MFKTSIKALVNNLGFSQNNIQGKEISLSLLRNELLAGITVSLALVPEAVAFAFVAGVAPLVGLYAAKGISSIRDDAYKINISKKTAAVIPDSLVLPPERTLIID